jgi:gp6-like head-tail connector protein
MADLVTLAEVKTALGIPTGNTTQDAKLTDAIRDASAAIRDYLDRDFETPISGSQARTFFYDGSGVLEISDAATITSVTLDGVTLTSDEYTAEPAGDAPYTWLFLPERGGWNASPEMGFMRNADQFPWWATLEKPQQVVVTGTWGFATIPDTVQRAAIWTAVAFAENPRPVTTESVGDVSRTYPTAIREGIPGRAKDILEPYFRGRF